VCNDFRINHSKLYENIDRSTLNWEYYHMLNKFDENEDTYYFKYIFCPHRAVYCYVENSPLTNNHKYYESVIDKHIILNFTKGK
jgi:hypothetical protein